MDRAYKIKAVAPNPKSWDSQYGTMLTYRLKLEGETKVIEINKKPDSPIPQAGDELFGHIEPNGEYAPKFKTAKKEFTKGSYSKSPEDQQSIYRSVALNNAAVIGGKDEEVIERADKFFSWLTSPPEKDITDSKEDRFEFGKGETTEDFGTDEINLDEIPF